VRSPCRHETRRRRRPSRSAGKSDSAQDLSRADPRRGAGLAVGRLQDKLKIAPSTLSHHIKALVVVGLVTQVRDATTLVCHANYEVMRELVGFLVAECCTESAETRDAKTAA